ncbi:MAG: (Fe-S)-binding protein, partial [Nitrospiria bacterium]
RFNIDALSRYEKVITGCASCTLMLKDYQAVLPDGEYHASAVQLASKVVHISEFLADDFRKKSNRTSEQSEREGEAPSGFAGGGGDAGPYRSTKRKKVTYHSSCHLRAAGVSKEPRDLLRQNPDLEFVEMADADRCAGGAGTFCIKNPEQSAAVFKRKEKSILESGAEIVATSCPACMIQLRNGLKGKVEVKHIAQL